MSVGNLTAQHLSLNVRYMKKVPGKRREEGDGHVEILQTGECRPDLRLQKARACTRKDPPTVKRRSLKAAAVTLGGMYILLLVGVSIRYALTTLRKDQLQMKYDDLRNNHSRLQDVVNQLKGEIRDALTALRKDQLQMKYDDLRNNHSRLQDVVKQLKGEIAGLCCPEGWTRFGCSCYHKSMERKKWGESRKDCQNREADLVVINTPEEQEFVREFNKPEVSWLGLKAEFKHKSTGWEPKWEWVDGSPLTTTFWETGHSQKIWYQYAECCNQGGKWTQTTFHNSNKCICERRTPCFPCQQRGV